MKNTINQNRLLFFTSLILFLTASMLFLTSVVPYLKQNKLKNSTEVSFLSSLPSQKNQNIPQTTPIHSKENIVKTQNESVEVLPIVKTEQKQLVKIEQKEFKKTYYTTVSAYSRKDCMYKGCVMESGRTVYVGAVSCPKEILLRTKVKIRGRLYTCEDRTMAEKEGTFELYMGNTRKDIEYSIAWGSPMLEIEVIETKQL